VPNDPRAGAKGPQSSIRPPNMRSRSNGGVRFPDPVDELPQSLNTGKASLFHFAEADERFR